MALQPKQPQQHVQEVCQIMLSYLSDNRNDTPNDMLEGIVSGKSLLRAILSGNLVICENVPDPKQGEKTRGASDAPVDKADVVSEAEEPAPEADDSP